MASIQVQQLPQTGRVYRRPDHVFNLRHRPWQIQPFMIAPVLPGETLKNALIQARVVTDPILNPLIGWWYEMYFFYVKHRDLAGRDDFTAMMLDITHDMSAQKSATAKLQLYKAAKSQIDWTQQCLDCVVEHYFRDQGEAVLAGAIDGLPAAQLSNKSWLDSAVAETDVPDGTPIDGTETQEELDTLQRTYEFMRANSLVNMTYEDWLRTYGVRTARAEDPHKPELVRYLREWQYPSNTIEPTTGAPSSAVSWAIAERADKDRFFTEPGFLFGVCVARPKVYWQNQGQSGVSLLEDAFAWLPAIMRDDPATSLRHLAAGTGPMTASSVGYIVDVRDLFLYGDQFLNFTPTTTDGVTVLKPLNTMTQVGKKYADLTDAQNLFRTPTGASPLPYVRADGIVSLSILGAEVDNT